MLQIDNACIAFGEDILFSEFCMRLNKGETACIAGQSGRGKTSLLNAIMGFVPLRKGKIKVGGILLEPTTIDAIRRHIAWIPQELALPSEWVKEMISLPFALKANRHISFSKEKLFTFKSCTYQSCLSGYKNHDDNPQEVNPWVIPQEKVFQVHTYQEELHDHACCPYQGGFQ